MVYVEFFHKTFSNFPKSFVPFFDLKPIMRFQPPLSEIRLEINIFYRSHHDEKNGSILFFLRSNKKMGKTG